MITTALSNMFAYQVGFMPIRARWAVGIGDMSPIILHTLPADMFGGSNLLLETRVIIKTLPHP